MKELTCPYCLVEFDSVYELERHEQTCEARSELDDEMFPMSWWPF